MEGGKPRITSKTPRRHNRTKGKQYKYTKTETTIEEQHPHTYTTRLGNKTLTRTTSLPLLDITYTTCPECNSQYYEYDQHHNERFCPECGLVLGEGIPERELTTLGSNTTAYKGLTREEKAVLARHGRHNPRFTDKKTWTEQNDKRMIQTITRQAGLNTTQTSLVHEIIEEVHFKGIHRSISKEEIILGISRYILKVSGTPSHRLRFNGVFTGLNRADYTVIESHLEEYFQ